MILNEEIFLINQRKNLKIYEVKSADNFLPGMHLQVRPHLLLVSLFLGLFLIRVLFYLQVFICFQKLEVSSKPISNLQQVQGNFTFDSLEFKHFLTLLLFT